MISSAIAMVLALQQSVPPVVSELRAAISQGNFRRAVSRTLKRERDSINESRRAFGHDQAVVVSLPSLDKVNSMFVASEIGGLRSVDPIVLPESDEAPLFDPTGESFERNGVLTICATDVYGSCSVPVLLKLKHANNVWRTQKEIVLGEPQLLEQDGPPTFARRNGKPDLRRIIVKYRKAGVYLEDGHAGPWICGTQVWKSKANGFRMLSNRRVETAFSQLDRIAGYRQTKDRRRFNASVPSRFRTKLWTILDAEPHVGSGPGPYHGDFSRSFWINRQWVVNFSRHNGRWEPHQVYEQLQDLG